jgi:DNA-directed RNA polymerase I, II, and III subunit RPABC1
MDKDELMNCKDSYLTHRLGDEADKIYIFFPQNASKVGVLPIRLYIKEMQANLAFRAIIIVKDEITAFAKQIFVESKDIIIEYFKENELLVDITRHILVPKHELLEEDEKKELLKIYSIKELNLPKCLSSDPISKYFGARKGQIFKIFRNSETSGESVYYRVVV